MDSLAEHHGAEAQGPSGRSQLTLLEQYIQKAWMPLGHRMEGPRVTRAGCQASCSRRPGPPLMRETGLCTEPAPKSEQLYLPTPEGDCPSWITLSRPRWAATLPTCAEQMSLFNCASSWRYSASPGLGRLGCPAPPENPPCGCQLSLEACPPSGEGEPHPEEAWRESHHPRQATSSTPIRQPTSATSWGRLSKARAARLD